MHANDSQAKVAPTRKARVVVASLIATVASIFPFAEHLRLPTRPTDFGIIWFGARSLLHGVDPYPLVGPGRLYNWDWELLYPATSMVLAIPLSWLPEIAAAIVFVWISTALLAYAVTEKSWNLLFLFPSSAFIVAARAAQWSPLYSAAFCLPTLGFVLSAKPNLGGAISLSTDSPKLLASALGGFIVLLAVSLFMLPSWPHAWLTAVSGASHLTAPIITTGGFTIVMVLLRWRRPEARLILFLACVPQTGSWYEALPLLLVAQTKRESQILSLVSSVGFLLIRFMIHGQAEAVFNRQVSALMVAFAYLPATIVVLRRPNEGAVPAWLQVLRRGARRRLETV
jgi:hypothetical protein